MLLKHCSHYQGSPCHGKATHAARQEPSRNECTIQSGAACHHATGVRCVTEITIGMSHSPKLLDSQVEYVQARVWDVVPSISIPPVIHGR